MRKEKYGTESQRISNSPNAMILDIGKVNNLVAILCKFDLHIDGGTIQEVASSTYNNIKNEWANNISGSKGSHSSGEVSQDIFYYKFRDEYIEAFKKGVSDALGDSIKDQLAVAFNDSEFKNELGGIVIDNRVIDDTHVANAIMAKSIKNSLCGSKKDPVIGFSKKAKERCFYFISAITYKHQNGHYTGENTLDYLVAQRLAEKLGENNVFWWENELDNTATSKLPVSTKIATGLGFATVFIGLAFDSTTRIPDGENAGKYKYNCLLDGTEAYKNPAYFKHEVETFAELKKNKTRSKKFVQGIVPPKQFKELVPQERYLRFYTLGEPDDYKYYSALDNRSYVARDCFEEIRKKLDENKSKEEKAEEIAEIIYQNIQKTCPKPAQTSQKEEYKYLYASFDPGDEQHQHVFSDGKYYDNFLGPDWGGPAWIRAGSKENIESIPADYFFEYAVVDGETGKNAKNHFLVFPERYNDEKGNFKWRMKLVVRDWNMRAIQDEKYRAFLLKKKDKPGADSLFPLSAYSEIKFYECIEKKGKTWKQASCQIYSDVSVADDAQSIYSGPQNHCAFILHDDMLNESAPAYNLTGLLQLCDPDSSKSFYISVHFYPKRVEYKKTMGKLRTPPKTPTRCPCCGRIKTTNDKFEKVDEYCYCENDNGHRTCQHNFIGMFYPLDNFTGRVKTTREEDPDTKDLKNVYGDFSKLSQYSKVLCDANCLESLPTLEDNNKLVYEDYDYGIVVTMVGVSASGKSTFISRMLSVHSEGSSDGGIFSEGTYEGSVSCDYLTNAMKPYVGQVDFVKVRTSAINNSGNGEDPYKYGINGLRLLDDYKTPRYGKFLDSTTNEEKALVLTHTPFIVELGSIQNTQKNAYVSFFDCPGGLFEPTNKLAGYHKDYTMLYRSDSIILLLSDMTDQQYEKKVETVLDTINNDVDRNNTIIAIVFCKTDILFKGDDWHQTKNSSPAAKENKFKGSKRQRYIDECSNEIKTVLLNQGIGEKIRKKAEEFKHHKFFAVSALGRGDSIIRNADQNNKNYTLYETSPVNIENVLLWILFEKGIIE